MDLKLLGLTDYEERVYRTLVKFGKSSASILSRESGVPYGKIYVVLGSLEAKQLVRVVPEKTKLFIPTNPQHLIDLVSQKEKELMGLKEDILDLKKIYDIQDEEVVLVAKGKKNFYKLMKETKQPHDFNYTVRYTSEYIPQFIHEHKCNMKYGVDVKSLVRCDEETKDNLRKWQKIRKDFRKIKNTGVALQINEHEVFIALIKSNTLLLIHDKPFIALMKRLFIATYTQSEKVKV